MTSAPHHLLRANDIGDGLSTRRVGRRIIVLPEVDSTNTFALNLASRTVSVRRDDPSADAPEQTFQRSGTSEIDGTVVFAERQTSGRGRLGRIWHCPRGAGLTLTIMLREAVGATTAAAWMMLAGVAVVRGIGAATEVIPSLRWPNDVYVANQKLAGILVESRRFADGSEAIAIGIGINCLQQPGHFPEAIRRRSVSLDMLSNTPIDRQSVARSVLMTLDADLHDLAHRDETRLIDLWQSHSTDIGTQVELRSDGHEFRGRILDVHPRDGLLVQLDDGGRRQFDPAVTSRA